MSNFTQNRLLKAACLGGAAAIALMAGTTNAHAVAYAVAGMELSNFLVTGIPDTTTGGNPNTNFQSFQFVEKANVATVGAATDTQPQQTSVAPAGTLDVLQACVVGGVPGSPACAAAIAPENSFSPGAGQGTGKDFARSDSAMLNTVIRVPSTGPAPTGGHFGSIAEGQAQGGVTIHTGNAGPANSMAWNFHLDTATVLTFSYNVATTFGVSKTKDGDTMQATDHFQTSISQNGEAVVSFADNGSGTAIGGDVGITAENDVCNLNRNANVGSNTAAPLDTVASCSGAASFTTISLAAGDYSLLVTFDSSITATSVPEPATLSLLGLGLLGLGYGIRRRRTA